MINEATALSSDCDIYINFPLSSITPKIKIIFYFTEKNLKLSTYQLMNLLPINFEFCLSQFEFLI